MLTNVNFSSILTFHSYRSVDPQQKSLALGLQTLIARGLGTVPGPIVFGYMIDLTCMLWSQDEDCSSGSCRLYNNTSMSYLVLAVLLIWKTLALLSFLVALFLGRDKPCNKS